MFDFPIYFELNIGETVATPAPLKLMKCLIQAKVSQGDEAPSGFQLVFESPIGLLDFDFPLLSESLLKDFNRVKLVVYLLYKPTVLIDGFITQKEIDPSTGNLTVTGEDVSAKMGLVELQAEYAKSKDSAIVNEILGAYSALVSKKVTVPKGEVAPVDNTPTQRCTDREQLQRLAQQNDFLFYIKPPTMPWGKSTAYWGPKELTGTRQKPISADSGTIKGNAENLSFSYNGLGPVLSYGEKMADGDGGGESKEVDFGTDTSTQKALAKEKTPLSEFKSLISDPAKARGMALKLRVRGKFIKDAGLDPNAADKTADTQTNRDTGDTVSISGKLDAVNYGAILQAPGLVGVRAVGDSFSGIYYIKKVDHEFKFKRSEMNYSQSFTLTREGLGYTTSVVK